MGAARRAAGRELLRRERERHPRQRGEEGRLGADSLQLPSQVAELRDPQGAADALARVRRNRDGDPEYVRQPEVRWQDSKEGIAWRWLPHCAAEIYDAVDDGKGRPADVSMRRQGNPAVDQSQIVPVEIGSLIGRADAVVRDPATRRQGGCGCDLPAMQLRG